MRRIAVAALITSSAFSAHADSRKACVEAADRGQVARDKGKLSEAREAFVACSREDCPTVVASQCSTWLGEVDHDMPTISIRAQDAQGHDLVEVGVIIDDTLIASALDGRAIKLDPGAHKLRFTHQGDPSVDQEMVARSGEKDRIIDVRFGAARPTPLAVVTPPATVATVETRGGGFRFPVFAGVMLGVGLASFGGMTSLLVTTSNDVNQMSTTCAPGCKQSDVDWANTRIVLANVAMGVGALGIGLCIVSLIVANVGHHSPQKTAWNPVVTF